MIRHVSVFTLKDKNRIDDFIVLLNEVGQTCPLIINSQVGKNIATLPPKGLEGPDFGDVIQMIDFASKDDADLYPQSKEHLMLFHDGPEMEKVTAIDFEFNK